MGFEVNLIERTEHKYAEDYPNEDVVGVYVNAKRTHAIVALFHADGETITVLDRTDGCGEDALAGARVVARRLARERGAEYVE